VRFSRLIPTTRLALIGTVLIISAGQASSLPVQSGQGAPRLQITPAGDKEAAAVAGAIVGGAVGVLLGSTLNQPLPPPPPVLVEEPVERIVVEKRPARRIVEIEEEDAPPQIVEECVTRRTKVYDPNLDEMVVRRERSCR
jgi:hypothetical protein